MSNPNQKARNEQSVLGPSVTLKGEISADEDLLLMGRVEGAISKAPNVRIGSEGSVKGDIRAQTITAEGSVNGDLHASSSITVAKSASIEGNIFSPTVSLVEGARFRGSIDMGSGEASAKAKPATQAAESAPSKPAEAATRATAVGAN
jgi:cytoskeletal protein CcmA (bactofilin family)